MIDRKFFYQEYRNHFGSLTQSKVNALNFLLDQFETTNDFEYIRHFAYVLATIKHETADTYLPIKEYGLGRGRAYGRKDPQTGQAYYGRGYVQLTWKSNYKKMSDVFGVNFVNYPDYVLDPKYAWNIMAYGMNNGSFTGKKLLDFINDNKTDYVGARRIINGTDKASLIAGYARKFQNMIKMD